MFLRLAYISLPLLFALGCAESGVYEDPTSYAYPCYVRADALCGAYTACYSWSYQAFDNCRDQLTYICEDSEEPLTMKQALICASSLEMQDPSCSIAYQIPELCALPE